MKYDVAIKNDVLGSYRKFLIQFQREKSNIQNDIHMSWCQVYKIFNKCKY